MIKKIELNDFKSHGRTALQPGPGLNLIYGPNGVGKSSIKDAIEFAITGACEGTDAAGRGAQRLITNNRREATALIGFDGYSVARTARPDGADLSVSDRHGDKKVLQAGLYERLGAEREQIHALINSTRILTLPPADQRELLLKAAGVMIPGEGLSETAAAWIQENDHHQEAGDIENRMFRPAEIENYYKQVFDWRRDLNRDRKTITMPEIPEKDPPKADAETVKARLDQLREQLQKAEAAAGDGLREELEQQRDKLVKEMEHAEGERDEMLRIESEIHGGFEITTEPEDLEKLDLEIEETRKEADRLGSEAAENQKVVDRLADIVERTKGTKALVCPAFEFNCPLPKDDIKEAKTKIRENHKKAEADTKALSKDALDAEKAWQALEKKGAALEEIIEAKPEYKAELEKWKTEAADAAKQIAELERRLTEAGAGEEGEGAIELESLRDRIQKGDAVYRWAVEYDALQTVRQQAETRLASLDNDLETAELLVEEFGPKGIRKEILGQATGALIDATNEHLQGSGLALEIQEEPWDLIVNGTPEEVLSTSEKLRTGAAIQAAMAKALGFGWVVIDNADMLDKAGRNWLIGFLYQTGIQAIVLFTAEADYRPPENLRGQAYAITKENGASTVERAL